MTDYDAVIVGAGHNGLVSALCLAQAGWRVLVLERGAAIGGAVQTAEVTLPGFQHDLFATNVGRFAVSPVYQQFRAAFEKTGLRFLANPYPFSSAYDGGKAARVYRDPAQTEAEMAAHSSADLAGWRRAVALFQRTAPHFMPLYVQPLPSLAAAGQVGRLVKAGAGDALRLARIFWQSPRQFTDAFFRSPEIKGLFTPWAFHGDYGPDVQGGATFAFIAALSAHLRGLFVAEGGAGRVVAALRTLIEARGGTIRTQAEVVRIRVIRGRAVAVAIAGGEEIGAARAIIANVTPRHLFGGLVPAEDIPPGFLRRIRKYRFGPGTFVVHLALDRKLEWRAAEDLREFNYVHICGTADDIARSYAQSLAGQIPTRPMLIVSQTTQVDPSRAPPGRHVARVHSRAFPAEIRGDAAGRITARDWAEAKEAVADRLIDILAEHAPNVRDAVLARAVVSPAELERGNPNLVGGDCNGGSHHLDQNYLFRPVFGWTRYRTPIARLYMIGAATWPGSGVNGSSGYLLAQHLLA